jgi:hypothetical protein
MVAGGNDKGGQVIPGKIFALGLFFAFIVGWGFGERVERKRTVTPVGGGPHGQSGDE